MQVGDGSGDAAVDLFGEGLPFVVGAQTGFHVPDAHPVVEGQQGGGHDGGGIALHQHPVRLEVAQHGVEVGEDGGGQLRQRLVGAHQVEVDVGGDLEQVEHLVEHLAVLGGDANQRFDAGRVVQALYDGRHFDGFRAGAKDGEDAHGG